MNRLQKFLSAPAITIICILTAIIASNGWQMVLPNFDVDNSFTLLAAKNLSEGHGYTIKMADAADFSKFHFQPLNKWPPGHSFLLFVVHLIFGSDWILNTYILNGLALTVLIFIVRRIFFQLSFPVWIINPATLFFGFFLYSFHYSKNTDLLAFLFYLTGVSLMIRALHPAHNLSLTVCIASFFLGMSVYMKYLYLPLAAVPLISLYVLAISLRNKNFRTAAVLGGVVLLGLILYLLSFQIINSGAAFFINPSKTGFFPEQILWLSPVVPASLLNLNFLNMQVSLHSGITYANMNLFWSLVNVLCIFWLIYTAGQFLKKRFSKLAVPVKFYLIQAMLFSIVLFVYLGCLSVIKDKHYYDTYDLWVYFGEQRYFLVFSFFVLQLAMVTLVNPALLFKGKFTILIRVMLVLIVFEEIAHGSYFLTRQFLQGNYGLSQKDDLIYFRTNKMVRDIATKNNIVYCSNSTNIANMAGLEGVPLFYEIEKLKQPVYSRSSVTLIIAPDHRIPGASVPMLSDLNIKPAFIFPPVKNYIIKTYNWKN